VIIKQIPVGPLQANCFIVGCKQTKEAVVIDPGGDSDQILMALAKDQLTVKHILNTHGHFDHVGANAPIKKATKAPLWIHKDDAEMLAYVASSASAWGLNSENSPDPDQFLNDNDTIQFGQFTITVLHTPGHSLGGVSFLTNNAVFVGDTLFEGSIGRTDFPGGDYNTLIQSVRNRLFTLSDDLQVYTGHGPSTTIGHEKRTNPFFQ